MEFERALDARLILSVLAVGILAFCGILVETAMNVSLPALMSEFAVGTSTVQWVVTGYLLVLAVVIPISSFLKKRWALKTLFVAAAVLFLAGSLMAIFAQSFLMLLLARFVQGVATGIAIPLLFNVVLDQTPLEHLGFMMGVATVTIACAPALGPTFAGWIVSIASWRMVFAVLIPLTVISLVLGVIFLRRATALEKVAFDAPGYLCLALCFVAALLGINFASSAGWLSAPVLALLAVAVVFGVAFVWAERRATCPVINLGIFKVHRYICCILIIFCMQFMVLIMGVLLPSYAQLVLGADSAAAGFITCPGFLLGAVLSPVFGRLFDKYGARRIILPGTLFVLLSGVLYYCLLPLQNIVVLTLIYPLFMLGQSHITSNTMTYGLQSLPERLGGDGNAMNNATQQLAGAVGTAVSTSILAMGQAQMPADFVAGTALGCQNAFLLLPVAAVVIIAAALLAVKR